MPGLGHNTDCQTQLCALTDNLADACDRLPPPPKDMLVRNPLRYARAGHRAWLRKFAPAHPGLHCLFVGVNPGPWGMGQTGVPFGQIAAVRDWMGLDFVVQQPPNPHQARPVQGLDCKRSEVSGARLWGLMQERFGTAQNFFGTHFVVNHCPLLFTDLGGGRARNLTPDKLPRPWRDELLAICDDWLLAVLRLLAPRFAISIGGETHKRLLAMAEGLELQVGRMPHPSPANPQASHDYSGKATAALVAAGVWPP